MKGTSATKAKWVVPGRAPAAPLPQEPSSARRRLRAAALLCGLACGLAALVLRLARPEDPAPAPAPPPLKVVRQAEDVEIYESENVRIVFKKNAPKAESETETEDVAEEKASESP